MAKTSHRHMRKPLVITSVGKRRRKPLGQGRMFWPLITKLVHSELVVSSRKVSENIARI